MFGNFSLVFACALPVEILVFRFAGEELWVIMGEGLLRVSLPRP